MPREFDTQQGASGRKGARLGFPVCEGGWDFQGRLTSPEMGGVLSRRA